MEGLRTEVEGLRSKEEGLRNEVEGLRIEVEEFRKAEDDCNMLIKNTKNTKFSHPAQLRWKDCASASVLLKISRNLPLLGG